MFKLRDYQENNANILAEGINSFGFYFFAGEMRTGKTVTALQVATLLECKSVLFVTKKKAITSVLKDFNSLGGTYTLEVLNYQSIHKRNANSYDLMILDESQFISSYPKPSKGAKEVKKVNAKKVLFMSGTFCPESYAQLFHQFYILKNRPTEFNYPTFYKWHKVYGIQKEVYYNGFARKDYSIMKPELIDIFKKYCYTFTQKQAGFVSKVDEVIHYVQPSNTILSLVARLKKDNVIEGKNEVILADTAVKLQSKLHQLWSGTVKFESGNTSVLDTSKADYIKEFFKGRKLAILYKFVAESDALKQVFKDDITTCIDEFNTTDKHFMGQIVSNREGVNLSSADELVMYNIDFSATSYWQGKERISSKDRGVTKVHWIFSKDGIESYVYHCVKEKKNFTLNIFKKIL